MYKNVRNKILTTLVDLNEVIEELESKNQHEKATDYKNQLVYAYV